jgi:hypothetical protein
MSRADPKILIRIPVDAKAFIEAEAKENASSQNSEIVRAIRAAMKTKGLSTSSQEQEAR